MTRGLILWLVSWLGLPGSWKWAVRQMKNGYVVFRSGDTGAARYRFSVDGQYRLEWVFSRKMDMLKWSNANLFFDDLLDTDWKRLERNSDEKRV